MFACVRMHPPCLVQSISFLKHVMVFRDSVHAIDLDEEELFRQFASLADKFIRDNSTFEVNVSSRAKDGVLVFNQDEAKFKGLDTVRRMQSFIGC